ncbi:MAG: hypothetical protein FWC20_09845 [Oscillospiraceae bacterium]|nr:hypothetical protein [Oscillospiraceae bacterium]MCL2279689.1 hypothetical protein [Oscillospiraceae bacterium]
MPSQDLLREMLNVMDTSTQGASESRIENLALRIFDINDNIQYNMNVVETISFLLSEKGRDILAVTSKISGAELTLTLENAGEYESIVSSIEMKFAKLADAIRKDMSKIEAISNLLSGEGLASAEEAPPDESASMSDEVADFASQLLPPDDGADLVPPELPAEDGADFVPPELPAEDGADFVPPPLPPDDEAEFVPPPLPPDAA